MTRRASSSSPEAHEPRPSSLASLEPRAAAIVGLVAVFCEGVSRTDIAKALGTMGDREGRRAPSAPEILPLLESLAARGWLVGDPQWKVRADLAHGVMLELTESGRLAAMADAVRALRPASDQHGLLARSTWWMALREARIELYRERWQEVPTYLSPGMFAYICQPFDRAWVERLPANLRADALMDVLDESARALTNRDEAFAMLEAMGETAPEALTDGCHHLLVEQLILRGRFDDADRAARGRASIQGQVGVACLLALRGRWSEAIDRYERALTAFIKQAGKRRAFFPDRAGFFFVVSLLADGKRASLSFAKRLASAAGREGVTGYPAAHAILLEASEALAKERNPDALVYVGADRQLDALDTTALVLSVAAAVWVGTKASAELLAELAKRALAADAAGYAWLASQGADAVLAAGGEDPSGRLAALAARLAGVSLARAVVPKERWSEALDALAEIATGDRASEAAGREPDRRLVWVVTAHKWGLEVSPREQSRAKNRWSKGRPVALKRLALESAKMDFLTPSDRHACAAIEQHVEPSYYGRYRDISYTLDPAAALRVLAGSANVFTELDGELVPLEIRQQTAKLVVQRAPAGAFRIVLDPMPHASGATTMVVHAGPTTIDLVELGDKHRAIAKVLGKRGLELPSSAEPRLREILAALSRFVPSDADLGPGHADASAGSELVAADPALTLIARRFGEGVTFEPIVRPLGARGPATQPGRGGASLFAEIDGRRVHANRDLAEERARLSAALASCPTLSSAERTEAGYCLRDRDETLAALLELRSPSAGVRVEWPEGDALEVTDSISAERLRVALRAVGERFEADASLLLPGGRAVPLSTLLDYLDASPGRFLKLGDDRFLALSSELRRRLDELRALGERSGKRLRFHRLVVAEVEELLEGAALRADDAWHAQRDRLRATGIEDAVPSTFRGELRPFQLDGFRWLARLGRWGAGACLADEMGLGKTVQALALLLSRAPEGPSLVVAPTSVLSSWAEQAARFAPTLRVRLYAGEDRARELSDIAPFDLVLTSYALLHADIDALAKVRFVVAVLDEAQAIKNPDSQRAKAATRLDAEQRIVMTGTPVENQLMDLWSLFHFASPGLLGSRASFEARFAAPIERARDPVARQFLKRLVAPFLLRRTKTAVTAELPARTEITLRVDLAAPELTLYELVRDEALRGLGAVKRGSTRAMHLLAAITRLRRAACSARLVLPANARAGAREASAKLEALGDLLDDLLPSGHKALIFSQFVDHLALVKEHLDARGVSYVYLDGSTPVSKRKTAIETFQAGRADVFLISLKAGGFGLNLTAADYVVHMDPWWNPAVEDQASDRAHRIGQSRPVTIYRLVAKHTIEDKIVELHHRKRELAAALLDESDAPSRMSEEEMLELIQAR